MSTSATRSHLHPAEYRSPPCVQPWSQCASSGIQSRPSFAEKVATAIALGPTNTRVRDYADIYTLTGRHVIAHRTAREALLATAAYRGTPVQPLSDAIENLVDLRSRTFNAYRNSLGDLGHLLPDGLQEVVAAVVTFADPLAEDTSGTTWQPTARHWLAT